MFYARLVLPLEYQIDDASEYQIIDASELRQWILNADDPLTEDIATNAWKYMCSYCNARVRPAAISKINPRTNSDYIVSPYFALCIGEVHDESVCSNVKENNSSERSPDPSRSGCNRCVRYPNRLSLDGLDSQAQAGYGIGSRIHNPDRNLSLFGNWTAKQILSLVNHFLKIEGRSSRLYIPGIEETTYDKVFERAYFLENLNQDKLRIYFSQFIYKKTSRTINNIFTFFLTDGTYNAESNVPIIKETLAIDASSWMHQDIKNLKQKIRDIEASAEELKGEGKLQKGKSLPWIFFLGYMKPENGSSPKLLCDNFRLVDLRITDKLNDIPDVPPSWLFRSEFLDSPSERSDSEQNEPSVNNPEKIEPPDFLEDETQAPQVIESREPNADDQESPDIDTGNSDRPESGEPNANENDESIESRSLEDEAQVPENYEAIEQNSDEQKFIRAEELDPSESAQDELSKETAPDDAEVSEPSLDEQQLTDRNDLEPSEPETTYTEPLADTPDSNQLEPDSPREIIRSSDDSDLNTQDPDVTEFEPQPTRANERTPGQHALYREPYERPLSTSTRQNRASLSVTSTRVRRRQRRSLNQRASDVFTAVTGIARGGFNAVRNFSVRLFRFLRGR